MEALQRAIAPLADRLKRLADAENTEALAFQIIEQREQLGRLVILLVRRVLVHQEGRDVSRDASRLVRSMSYLPTDKVTRMTRWQVSSLKHPCHACHPFILSRSSSFSITKYVGSAYPAWLRSSITR